MNSKLNRRAFIEKTALTSAGIMAAGALSPLNGLAKPPAKKSKLNVVRGEDYFAITKKAIASYGGLNQHINKGDKVGLLINSDFEEDAAYFNPDMAFAVLESCFEAGASKVICLQNVKETYWKRSSHYEKLSGLLENVRSIEVNQFPAEFNEENWKIIEKVDGAVHLANVEVIKAIDQPDVFINMPIGKHHFTTHFTGAIKNMMGICTRKTNVGMHLDGPARNDPEYLGQCLADILCIRQPDLVIMDSTEFITTNGPMGPGDIGTEQAIIIGTDAVAVDAVGAGFLGFAPDEIVAVQKAYDMGFGQMHLKDIKIKEETL